LSTAEHIPSNLKRASRAIGYAAWLDHPDHWAGLPVVFKARLTERQCAGLAYATLCALDDETAALTFGHACELAAPAGQPIAPLFNHMDEAAFWADLATPAELDAYALASFNAMHPSRKAAFLDFVQERKAVA